MTREDAIYYLQSSGFSEEQINTIEQAFIPKPCVDAISRQAVIKHLHNEYHGMISDESMKIYEIINMLKEQPPVTPKPRTGHWDFFGDNCFSCTECGEVYSLEQFNALKNYKDDEFPKWCPNCGADMREVEE